MGLLPSKPEFATVLPDVFSAEYGKQVTLECETNAEDVTATWEKDDRKFVCVQGKHRVSHQGKMCTLEIFNATESDEGKYTLTLSNKWFSESCYTIIKIELIRQWREVQWDRDDDMIINLQTFRVFNRSIEQLNFLLYGLVGVGKSSIINTIRTIFEGRVFVGCLAASKSATSNTLSFGRYRFKNEDGLFPFAFYDVMGAEAEAKEGVNTQDIISALKGHMKDGYTFNSNTPLSENDLHYNGNPGLSDQMHCLVNVIAADRISLMNKRNFNTLTEFSEKWKTIRDTATSMGIPQVLFMTFVDCACPLTRENLQNVYKSKKIKEKMTECSNLTGIPMNCIFPVMNYPEQTSINTDINCLMLNALKHIVHFANDFVDERFNNENPHRESHD